MAEARPDDLPDGARRAERSARCGPIPWSRWANGFLFAFVLAGPARAGLPAAPVLQWEWQPPEPEFPLRNSFWNAPLVVQVTDDDGSGKMSASDVPDIVFLRSDVFRDLATLTALDGATGAHHWSRWDVEMGIWNFSAADLDGDGVVELLAPRYMPDGERPNGFLVLDHEGNLLDDVDWPALPRVGGHDFGIGDIDQDGTPEVFEGASVLSSNGSWSWVGEGVLPCNDGGWDGFSHALDLLPESPGLEVLLGNALYTSWGSLAWRNEAVGCGTTAVGDVDGNCDPEIVIGMEPGTTPGTWVLLLDHLGTQLGARLPVPQLGQDAGLSGPTMADLDGDGDSEVLVPGPDTINAYGWDGAGLTLLWSTPRGENWGADEPFVTPFDFDGDGSAEVVGQDDHTWFILDGRDGALLHEALFDSHGIIASAVVVANLDNDPSTEIVLNSPRQHVIVAYEVPGSCRARSIYNGRTYHVTNIGDDGSVPRYEQAPWLAGAGFRDQAAAAGSACAPPCRGAECRVLGDVQVCRGDDVVLDASALAVAGCPTGLQYEWRDGPVLLGTAPLLVVSPSASTDYEVTVTCAGEPACSVTGTIHVDVENYPDFEASSARASDPSTCGQGLLLEWPTATWLDAAAGGTYNIYRSDDPSAPSCADALSRPPVASGLTGLSWMDRGTTPGQAHAYVVEAEDGTRPAPCPSTGPDGGATSHSCIPSAIDFGMYPFPSGVGAVLRAAHGEAEVTVSWAAARPLLVGEAFVLLVADASPQSAWARTNPAGDTSRAHVETGTGPRRFYDLRVENPCGEMSEVEFPATGSAP